jgi:hypothetical protein
MRKVKRLVAVGALVASLVVPVLLISPGTGAAAPVPQSPKADVANSSSATPPTADQLLAKLSTNCDTVTKKPLRPDDDAPRSVPMCGMKGAVFAQTGLLVDCDGQRTEQCNENTDCCFQNDTAFHQSDGQPLNAAALPYIVLPEDSSNWRWQHEGIDGGSVAAVIYNHQLTYAVVGDTDVPDKVPQGSYATAKALGMNPDPKNGGVDSGVTYIVFENAKADPIESHGSAVSVGERAAEAFLKNN